MSKRGSEQLKERLRLNKITDLILYLSRIVRAIVVIVRQILGAEICM